MGHLSKADSRYLRRLRRLRILEELSEANLVGHHNGVTIVACGDGDQFPDVFKKHAELCLAHRTSSRIHTLTLNGGALLIPPNSPLNVGGRGRILVEDILGASDSEMKGIRTVVLYGHLPCGMVAKAKLTAYQCIRLLIQAKDEVKFASDGQLKVACFFHVEWRNGRKRTYFISATKWRRRRTRRPKTK